MTRSQPRSRHLLVRVALAFAALFAALPLDAGLAHATAAEGHVRVYVLPKADGDPAIRNALNGAVRYFESALSATGAFRFAGSQDLDGAFSQCREAAGTNASEVQDCQLRAARRNSVKWVFEFALQNTSRGHYDVSIDVWDPEEGHKDFTAVVDVQGANAGEAARKGMQELARQFLASPLVQITPAPNAAQTAQPGVPQAQVTTPNTPATPTTVPTPLVGAAAPSGTTGTDGRIEVLAIEPATADIYVNNRKVGTGPGQYFSLPTGQVTIELRAPGFQNLTRTLSLSPGQMEIISGLRMEGVPGTLAVSCNIEDAAILVDGTEIARTRRGSAVSLEVAATAQVLEVRREGYGVFLQNLALRPGARQAFDVRLSPQATPPSGQVSASVAFNITATSQTFSGSGTTGNQRPGAEGCAGRFAETPHFLMAVSQQMNLRLIARSPTGDASMMIEGPGFKACDDDSAGQLDPKVEQAFAPGTYQIYVGQVSEGEPLAFALTVEPFVPGPGQGSQPFVGFTGSTRTFSCAATFECIEINPAQALAVAVGGTSGGSRPAPGNCAGTIAEEPDHVLYVDSPANNLTISVTSAADTTLVIDGPGGIRCADDVNGINPAVTASFVRGEYKIYVGSYTRDQLHPYSLGVAPSGVALPSAAPAPQPGRAAGPSRTVTCNGATFDCFYVSPGDRTTLTETGASGGSNPAPGSCVGNIANGPDHKLFVTGYVPHLRVAITQAEGDTTLVIQGPNGLQCADDSDGLNPVVEGPFAPGEYNIWVGTYSNSQMLSYTMQVSQ